MQSTLRAMVCDEEEAGQVRDSEGGCGDTDPNVKQMEKASPISARDFDLVFASVTSLMIALWSKRVQLLSKGNPGMKDGSRAELNISLRQSSDESRQHV
jgi:hypothetical protein